jgi:hypothetical protein
MGKKRKQVPVKQVENKVNEPEVAYQKNHKIRIFHSFEEAEEADLEEILNIAPVDRVRYTVDLILRMYKLTREDLKKRIPNNKITITRYE